MFFNRTTRLRPAWPTGLTLTAALGVGLAAWSTDVRAQAAKGGAPQQLTKSAKPNDPKALALFRDVAKAYKSLSSYSDHGEFVQAMTISGKAQKQATPLKVTLVRPNKMEIDLGPVQLISDGKTMTTSVAANLKKFTQVPAPKTIDVDTFRQNPTGAMLFGGPAGPSMYVLLNLLTAPNPVDAITQLGGSLQPASAVGGKADDSAFSIAMEGGLNLLLTIEPTTKLLSEIEMKIDIKRVQATLPPGQTLTIEQFGWRSGAVSTDVAADKSFAFQPPAGFKKVESLVEQREQPGEQKYAVSGLVDKPAPNFTLTVLDGPGKTKTITKAELAGKVVVIDFWATWCGPCLMELPEIQKVVEAYAASKKDVLVVALSQDSEPDEVSEVRALVEKTLKTKNITLTGNSVGLIALDPSGSIGKAFSVEGFPTLVILDAKGVVRSAHVGYDPRGAVPFNKALGKEIDTLLEGKSLSPHGEQGKVPAGK
jgi:thiol-disulfide isomerase/thioredoxin